MQGNARLGSSIPSQQPHFSHLMLPSGRRHALLLPSCISADLPRTTKRFSVCRVYIRLEQLNRICDRRLPRYRISLSIRRLIVNLMKSVGCAACVAHQVGGWISKADLHDISLSYLPGTRTRLLHRNPSQRQKAVFLSIVQRGRCRRPGVSILATVIRHLRCATPFASC